MRLAVALTFLLSASALGQEAPDLLLLNGKAFTASLSKPSVEAIAIRGDRIIAAGAFASAPFLSR
jgi:predicted amidohydrolase YtcJ